MSNCISIRTSVTFYNDEMDLRRLKHAVDRYQHVKPDMKVTRMSPEEYCHHMVWWFLSGNVYWEQDAKGNPTGVTIEFGHGRSSHTWRDFEGLCKMLNELMWAHQAKRVSFTVKDEDIGGDRFGPYPVVFKHEPPAQQHWPEVAACA